ncbi:MAG: hypothetical protein BWX88_03308 [Planctomycetes bacterium ADurb.Bin126]|nr:MAG: hypothetical protein BWX88_03308 [Planctomycetes bacterium ADurb.Bin126]HOD80721.1 hypothetical protein [Phycisphaerae bacterium]HQL74921.1 hypothetical protein [Phycisphaerae bacterium]
MSLHDQSRRTRAYVSRFSGRAILACLAASALLLAARLPPVQSVCGAGPPLAPGERDVTDQVLRDIEQGRFMILRYDNCRGTVSARLNGSAGGKSSLAAQFDGLYVICEPVLRHLLSLGGPMSKGICDLYHIYPQRLTVSSRGRFVEYIHPDITDTYTWARTRTLTLPELPAGTMTQQAVEMWHEKVRALHKERNLGAFFTVRDRSKADGDVRIMPTAFVGDQTGITLRRTQPGKAPRVIRLPLGHFFMGDPVTFAGMETRGVTSLTWWNATLAELVAYPSDFSLLGVTFHHRFRMPQYPAPHAAQHPRNDQFIEASLFYSVGLAKEVDAILTPYTPAEGTFMPVPNTTREYKLEIRSPPLAEIEAVRFRLFDVSRRPGICCNAKVHAMSTSGPGGCPHCKAGRVMTQKTVSQHFNRQTYLPRLVTTYDDCPADDLPDLYFTDSDNGEPFQLSGEVVEDERLAYKAADELVIESPRKQEYVAKVRVMDGAAAGKLTVELLVGGAWVPAAAMGDTADIKGVHLYIPNDQDETGVADAWENAFGADLSEDNDASVGGPILGDGLSSREEYRGFLIARNFERTSPKEQDLFVTDDGGLYVDAIDRYVTRWYAGSGVTLHRLHCDEFKGDVVNWTDESARLHAQHLIVVMQHMVMPLGQDVSINRHWIDLWQKNYVGWSPVSWPRKELHTVFVRNDSRGAIAKARTVGHEMGHQLNLPHHGQTDETIDLTGQVLLGAALDGKYYVAVRGGQHSGNHLCLMRYACADLYCDSTSALQPFADHKDKYKKFMPIGWRQQTLFCDSPAGTGFNANGNWCGDATSPACRQGLRIRSE